MLSDVVPLSV
jgi:hypothetical protein